MTELDAHLTALAARFALRLPTERTALLTARDDPEVLIVKAHKLAGIAGMFGRTDIGDAALALEERLRSGATGDVELAELLALMAAPKLA